jgi:hypothetical protein
VVHGVPDIAARCNLGKTGSVQLPGRLRFVPAPFEQATGNIPIPRSKYEENKYKPDFDKLPSEAEYLAAEKKKEDDAKGS